MAIPDQQAWNAWQPAVLAQRLRGIHLPWCVVGGWALDLWHGARTRERAWPKNCLDVLHPGNEWAQAL